MDKEDFESLQTKGTIKPGMKIWRQNGGSIFQVKLTRNFTVGKVFSINSFGEQQTPSPDQLYSLLLDTRLSC